MAEASAAVADFVPLDTLYQIEKMLPVFGFDDAPARSRADSACKRPCARGNILLGEGRVSRSPRAVSSQDVSITACDYRRGGGSVEKM